MKILFVLVGNVSIIFFLELKKRGFYKMSETWVQVLTIVGSNLVIMLTFFGVTISLHNGLREDIRAIHEEMKDFHGRLCAIEERNRKG